MTAKERVVSVCLRMLPVKHGKHRLLDKFSRLLGRLDPSLRRVREGRHEILLDVSDLIGRHYLLLGSFDPEVVDVLSTFATGAEEVFWDVGANKGVICYQILRRVPGIRVVAFEPQRRLAEVVRHNLESLCPGRFEVVAAGLGEVAAELELAVPPDNTGKASLHFDPNDSACRKESVRILTADDAVRKSEFGWPSIVKVDVEGHEPEVLRSLEPALCEAVPKAVVFEHLDGLDDRFRAMRDLLIARGYGVFAIEKSPLVTVLRSLDTTTSSATDFVGVRKDLLDPGRRGTISLRELKRSSG